jgi:transmembrane sensor
MSSAASTAERARDSIPPERVAEASVWVARLHGGAPRHLFEEGFRQWLHESPLNAQALELATDVWEDAASLRRIVELPAAPRYPVRFRPVWGAVAAAAVMVLIAFVLYQRAGIITTGVGEQRQVVLEDGSRIFLNTATRVAVHYGDKIRRVDLATGEALFNVAKNPDRPFIVVAGDRQVRALGTSFVVRKDSAQLSVALMEGQVAVKSMRSAMPVAPPAAGGSAAAAGSPPRQSSASNAFTLSPGQRLTFAPDAAPLLDRPSLDKVTAWRRGQVILEDTRLTAAVAEMNRYNSTKLVIRSSKVGELRVSGLFQVGDSTNFARAVALTYGLYIVERDGEILLAE